MERREKKKKKRGREGEKSGESNAKKRELLMSGNSCLCDNNNLEEGSNDHHPRKVCEDDNGSEVGVFDFPWLKEGTTSNGYYDNNDHYECRLEFEDLVSGCWSGGAYDDDFSLDHHFFQHNLPSDDRRLSSHRTTTMTRKSDDDRGGELPILRDKNVEELDGIWSSVLDQPLDNSIVSFHKL